MTGIKPARTRETDAVTRALRKAASSNRSNWPRISPPHRPVPLLLSRRWNAGPASCRIRPYKPYLPPYKTIQTRYRAARALGPFPILPRFGSPPSEFQGPVSNSAGPIQRRLSTRESHAPVHIDSVVSSAGSDSVHSPEN